MNRKQTLLKKLMQCHIIFPSYGERSKDDLEIIAEVFEENLGHYSADDVTFALDCHIKRGAKRFPMVSDIIDLLEAKTCYRMNNGPLGFGAVYHADHPYVRLQAKVGTDLAKYAIEVRAIDASRYEAEARVAPEIAIQEDEEKQIEPRTGSSFRLLRYDV